MSATWPCTICNSAIGAPDNRRVVTRLTVSSSARRAKPSAAAPTVVRNTSSVAMAILKPSPGLPIIAAAGTRQLSKRRRASGCGAITVEAFGDGETRIAGFDDEGRDAARAVRFAGAGEHHVEVGDAAVRNPGLLAVEHVILAVAPRGHGDVGDVGAGGRLGQREGGDRRAGAGARQPGRALRLAAEQRDRPGAEALHGEGKVGQPVVARQRLARERERTHVERRAVFVRRGQRQPAGLAQLRDQPAAGGVGVAMVDAGEIAGRPGVELAGQRAVARLEKRPVEIALVHPQSPAKRGVALAMKAS